LLLRFLEQERCDRRTADHQRELAGVGVDADYHRDAHPGELLRLLVDLRYDLTDVDAEGAERGAERCARRRLATLDEDAHLNCHSSRLPFPACARGPRGQ